MRKLRIGVWLNDNIEPKKGGAYSYYTELINGLSKYFFRDAEIIFLSNKTLRSSSVGYKIIKNNPHKLTILKLILKVITKFPFSFKSSKKIEEIINKRINKYENEIYKYVDIIYHTTPVCNYTNIPYIYTLWDLGHISSYAFPEFSMNENFEYRKKLHDILPHKALMIFTESEAGKDECEKYLNINKNRIKVIPIFPSEVISSECSAIKPTKMKRDDFFIHYPAQYWAHKNHYNLLLAMASVIKIFPKLKLALAGSDKGNKEYILETISELKLEKNVIDLGFISTQELRWLYENSQGLVMPSLLGPTNMPLLEAAELGCPVACTNLLGHIEQLGDYGYYFNGINSNDIAEKIVSMINDKKNGLTKKYNNKFNINNTLKSLDEAFTELKQVRFCWKK